MSLCFHVIDLDRNVTVYEVEQTGLTENEFLMHSVKAATWCCFKVIKLECGFKVANRHFISNVMRIKLFVFLFLNICCEIVSGEI